MSHALDSPRRPTYADIEALPPHVVGEILGGELVVSPRPAVPHATAMSQLGAALIPPFDRGLGGPGGWRILDEPELSLGVDPDYDPVVPDLAGWRISVMPEALQTAQVHLVPQWVCEVVSPRSQRTDRVLKLPFYARAGVGHVWLIDPLSETLEVYALHDAEWRLRGSYGGDATVRAEPFDAVPLELTWLWGRRPAADAGAEADPAVDR
ncbi:MAG: Uma2 family endonuclease [Deltaproteobacteria bacterium]|nr:Uma2 family endonuclease [Deltaproteobacteria bacterium]